MIIGIGIGLGQLVHEGQPPDGSAPGSKVRLAGEALAFKLTARIGSTMGTEEISHGPVYP